MLVLGLSVQPRRSYVLKALQPRARLRGGSASVRGCLKPGDRWGMGLPLRALEAGSPGYVVQQRRRAQGLHSHPGGAACTARAEATTRPRALTALIPKKARAAMGSTRGPW